jgi:uncharacterized membrane protein (DUF4010 family)
VNLSVEAGLARLALALLVGLLIGLDRERAEARKGREMIGGVRTFPLIALAGAVPMLLPGLASLLALVTAFVAVAAVAVASYVRQAAEGRYGATTEVAVVATCLLGALAGAGQLLLAGAAGIAVSVLLVAKPRLEAFSRALSPEELAATLELAVISVIVLPLLPDRGYGPWQVFNPRTLWLVVVLVAGLSFLGFVAVRVVGEGRGLAITGAVGGLVSSTAVTVAMADRSREGEAIGRAAAAAAVLASTVMAGRVAVLAGAINPGIVPRLLPVVFAVMLTGALAARAVARRRAGDPVEAGGRIRNPFSLRQAVTFALIYALILLIVRAAMQYFGAAAIFAVAALSSLADLDAVTIAFTQLGARDLSWRTPAAAIALAVVTNTVVKLGIAWVRGAGAFRGYVAASLGAMAVVGAAAGVIVYLRA